MHFFEFKRKKLQLKTTRGHNKKKYVYIKLNNKNNNPLTLENPSVCELSVCLQSGLKEHI